MNDVVEIPFSRKSKTIAAPGRFFVCRYASRPFDVLIGSETVRIDTGDSFVVPQGFSRLVFKNLSDAQFAETLVVAFYVGSLDLRVAEPAVWRTIAVTKDVNVTSIQPAIFPGTLTMAQSLARFTGYTAGRLGQLGRRQIVISNLDATESVFVTTLASQMQGVLSGTIEIPAESPPFTLFTNDNLTLTSPGTNNNVLVTETFYLLAN